jgi:L-ascorbate metabolism protein UlaG (beta-lactamase superfamily)
VAGNILFAQAARRTAPPKTEFEEDIIPTSGGDLKITSLAKSSVMFTFDGKVIYVDPVAQFADYSRLPKADLILITNDESDHLDTKTIELLRKDGTALVVCPFCARDLPTGTIMINGETQTVAGLKIEAVPAYNIKGRGGNGKPFTVKGTANGYVVTFGDKRVYVASQTENVPEVKALRNIDVAFLPVNNTGFGAQLNTMNHEMFIDTVKTIRPKIVFPYNFGNNDPQMLARLVAGEQGIEVRVHKMN